MGDISRIRYTAGCKQQIIRYLTTYQYASVAELQQELRYSRQLIHRELKKLLAESLVYKSGKSPKVLYLPKG